MPGSEKKPSLSVLYDVIRSLPLWRLDLLQDGRPFPDLPRGWLAAACEGNDLSLQMVARVWVPDGTLPFVSASALCLWHRVRTGCADHPALLRLRRSSRPFVGSCSLFSNGFVVCVCHGNQGLSCRTFFSFLSAKSDRSKTAFSSRPDRGADLCVFFPVLLHCDAASLLYDPFRVASAAPSGDSQTDAGRKRRSALRNRFSGACQ